MVSLNWHHAWLSQADDSHASLNGLLRTHSLLIGFLRIHADLRIVAAPGGL